jgi:glycosyltransferase involved in cell wall biosynthesis
VRPLLSAALIVRDEAQFIGDCLSSVAGVVEEVVVVDTGSTDGTPEIARRLGARVVHHPWRNDFADARNVSLELAQGRWILYIDADERLVDGDRATVERLLSEADEVAFRVLLRPMVGTTPYLEYRLWRNDPRIRFEGIIHEKVVPAIHRVAEEDGRSISDCTLLLAHVGYEGDQVRKHHRNLPLLRAEIPKDPNNLFKRHHLARVLVGLGRDDEAAVVLEQAAGLARRVPRDPVGVLVFTELVRLRRERGEDVGELLAEARTRYPGDKLLWWVQATVHMSAGRPEQALELLDRLLGVDLSSLPAEGPSYDERMFNEFAYEARGICLFRLGRYAEAADAFAQACRCDPSHLGYRAKQQVALGRARGSSAARAAARQPLPRR